MSLSRPRLRALIQHHFRSDSDFDAFCSDHFPDVRQRMSDGMDRVRKVTLILEYADLERLTDILQHYNRSERTSHSDLVSKQPRTSWPRLKVGALVLAGMAGSGGLVVGALLMWSKSVNRVPEARLEITVDAGVAPQQPVSGLVRVFLDTQPSGARVIRTDRHPPDRLGRTPLDIYVGRPTSKQYQFKLQLDGYPDVDIFVPVNDSTMTVTKSVTLTR